MNKEKQRIEIAKTVGWSATCTTNGVDIRWAKWSLIPDYPSDLNAMHEAEKVLSPPMENADSGGPMWGAYVIELAKICNGAALLHATAAQRAEALLRTIGKWEEDK